MKKLLFMALALAFTTYSATSNASQYVSNLFAGTSANNYQLEQQSKSPLVLDKYQNKSSKLMAAHYSHSSHASHASHSSHASHYSHYSARY